MNAVKHFIKRVRQEARVKASPVTFRIFGEERVFVGYDWGCDTFIFEKNIWSSFKNHAPVLLIKKSDISKGAHGYIFTLTSGNHSVALVPLVSGAFWNIASVSIQARQDTITRLFMYANVVNGKLEISQREADSAQVVGADTWLQSHGFQLDELLFAERNSTTLEIYRRQGQEWRIKPLAWTGKEMLSALNLSRTVIHSKLRYYHSTSGVHFLSYTGFRTLLELVDSDYEALRIALNELVCVYKGQLTSNMRTVKINNHHEIELFGLRIGTAEIFLIPGLEELLNLMTQNQISVEDVKIKLYELAYAFRQSLERPALADEKSRDFIETMYIHLSGEIYQINSSSISAAFDSRRTALPGATFRGNRPEFHAGTDRRTKVLIYNLEQLLSNDEQVEYVNVYELRDKLSTVAGSADTREIVFKTNRRPLLTSLIEKRLAQHTPGYGNYVLARVQAFQALGIRIGDYRLLARLDNKGLRRMNFFLRNRCPGEPLEYIKPRFSNAVRLRNEVDTQDSDVAAAIAALLGQAAAQNLIMKKYIAALDSCRFGEGKEIFAKGFNAATGKAMPQSVMLCSMRGAFGWPDIAFTEDNIGHVFDFYLTSFVKVLHKFWYEYRNCISLHECAERFISGFECETKEVYWNYVMNREAFDSFDPHLHSRYAFVRKWKFVLWALEQQHLRLDELHTQFYTKVTKIFEDNDHRRLVN